MKETRHYYQVRLHQIVVRVCGGDVTKDTNGKLRYIAVKTEMVALYVAIKSYRLVLMI